MSRYPLSSSSPASPSPVEGLEPCPFCGANLIKREHSAFHPDWSLYPYADCWLARAGENGGPYELPEHEYDAWNRRS